MNFDALRRRFEPVTRRVLHFYWRFSRGLTLGVRAVVIDHSGKVFLIVHSYVPGWHLPGGGVEIGETAAVALARELREEGNIELVDQPTLFGVYFNRRISRRDHVALYVVRAFRQPAPPVTDYEIMEHGFFARDALPEGTVAAVRSRIAEVLDGAPLSSR